MKAIVKMYLWRQFNGLYGLSCMAPVTAAIVGMDKNDMYPAPGDPARMHNFCPYVVEKLFGVKDLQVGNVVRVKIVGDLV